VGCHGSSHPKDAPDLTDTPGPHGFLQSYRSLFGIEKHMPTPLGEGYREAYPDMPDLERDEDVLYEVTKKRIYSPHGLLSLSDHMSGPEVTEPRQFGSHRSRLVLSLLEDAVHQKDVNLSADEWETLVTWVDANAPYRSTYYQYFNSGGEILPHAIQVRIELDPPFQAGEKSCRVIARQKPFPDQDAAVRLPPGDPQAH
jgi:hypothetical protein